MCIHVQIDLVTDMSRNSESGDSSALFVVKFTSNISVALLSSAVQSLVGDLVGKPLLIFFLSSQVFIFSCLFCTWIIETHLSLNTYSHTINLLIAYVSCSWICFSCPCKQGLKASCTL